MWGQGNLEMVKRTDKSVKAKIHKKVAQNKNSKWTVEWDGCMGVSEIESDIEKDTMPNGQPKSLDKISRGCLCVWGKCTNKSSRH